MRYTRFIPPKHKPGPECNDPLPKNPNEVLYMETARFAGILAKNESELLNPYRSERYHKSWAEGNYEKRALLTHKNKSTKLGAKKRRKNRQEEWNK